MRAHTHTHLYMYLFIYYIRNTTRKSLRRKLLQISMQKLSIYRNLKKILNDISQKISINCFSYVHQLRLFFVIVSLHMISLFFNRYTANMLYWKMSDSVFRMLPLCIVEILLFSLCVKTIVTANTFVLKKAQSRMYVYTCVQQIFSTVYCRNSSILSLVQKLFFCC